MSNSHTIRTCGFLIRIDEIGRLIDQSLIIAPAKEFFERARGKKKSGVNESIGLSRIKVTRRWGAGSHATAQK